ILPCVSLRRLVAWDLLVNREFTDRARPARRPGARLPAWRSAAVIAVVAAAILPPPTRATTANDLCSPSADPCRVTTTVSVTPGSMIDVGTRTLQIANHGILDLISGTMTLNAGTLTVDIGGLLRARGTGATAGGQIIATAGVITINGGIDASGAPGGDANLTS